MFWTKKETHPLGVHLAEIAAMLEPRSLKASLTADALVVRHEHYSTRVEVAPPEDPLPAAAADVQAVVRVVTELPAAAQPVFESPATAAMMNAFAALGAMTVENGIVRLGSRLCVGSDQDAWHRLYLPLLACAASLGAEAELGKLRRSDEEGSSGADVSAWTPSDLESVQRDLASGTVCRVDGRSLAAEFALPDHPDDAARPAPMAATLLMSAEHPHSEIGGGLLCVTRVPHRSLDRADLASLCARLNHLEMTRADLAPHFGAWCESMLAGGLAYVSFLPNALHPVPQVAVHFARWARQRATWAYGILPELDAGR